MIFLIVNGPNLNLLGKREPEIYGTESLNDINVWLQFQVQSKGDKLQFFQSNHEGAIIDYLQGQMGVADGAVINPGALTHYSYALRDTIQAMDFPVVEVHLSDIHNREPFRRESVITEVCVKQISGKGKAGYLEAINLLQGQ
ncbi:MAG: 3-dehydroquinate dehydratase [Candidatus Marinimicrobia bacterium]|nr:3-dehydroquinate dehydratase [Candidatus Neomarinimicrobiota bacterium]